MKTIPSRDYLDDSLNLSEHEVEFVRKYNTVLPNSIIDVHTHSNLPRHVIQLPSNVYSHMISTFPDFSIEDSERVDRVLHQGKKVAKLRFANAYRGIDHRAANEYLLKSSPPLDRVAFYGIPDDVDYTINGLQGDRVSALKMYYFYFDTPATEIYQYFKPDILEVCKELDIPIILHLPRPVVFCFDQLKQLLADFKGLKVVLAHVALLHQPFDGYSEVLKELRNYQNVFVDTSMIANKEVFCSALSYIGRERVLYGSDEPLNLVRSKGYYNEERKLFRLAARGYHWVDKDEEDKFGYLADNAVHMHWASLEALVGAINTFAERQSMIDSVFKNNAIEVYKFRL